MISSIINSLSLILLWSSTLSIMGTTTPVPERIKGLSFVAPPDSFQTDPFKAINAVKANWISVIPYAFTRKGDSKVRYNEASWQWWGERPAGVITTIKEAHKNGLNVMLKPQIYMHGSWVGDLHFHTEKEWQQWEEGYRKFLMEMAHIAAEHDIGAFCIGTEFTKATLTREQFWRDLIKDIRKIYCGQLTYSANWDYYQEIPFWDALDYVGLSAYFPLSSKINPSKQELLQSWKPIVKDLNKFHNKTNKPILFTEMGYLSVDGCASKTWELEKKVHTLKRNDQAQSIALDAMLSTFWIQDWWAGGFLWKWFPNGKGHEGYIEKDYTPQGKVASQTLTNWYSK